MSISKELATASGQIQILRYENLEEADWVCFSHFKDFQPFMTLDNLQWKTWKSHMDGIQLVSGNKRAKRPRLFQNTLENQVRLIALQSEWYQIPLGILFLLKTNDCFLLHT